MPPREWTYDYNNQLKDKIFRIKYILELSYLPCPYNWHDDDMTIFDQACFGEIPDITGH